jgi:hypothetical protein
MVDQTKLGILHFHEWIQFAKEKGVAPRMMWEWLFRTRPESRIAFYNILLRLDELVADGRLTLRQLFDNAVESLSRASASVTPPDVAAQLRERLAKAVYSWENAEAIAAATETERGINNIHGWINFAGASGVPDEILWEWLFHTEPEGIDILDKVADLIRSGQVTVRQMFDIAAAAISRNSAYEEAGDPSMIDHVRQYLQDCLRGWEDGF